MAASDCFEELGEIGDKPHNEIQVRFLNPIETLDIAGYVVKLEKAKPLKCLRDVVVAKIDVPPDALHLASEGQDMDLTKTVADNGIVEPGPAARRKGEKVQLVCQLVSGTLPGVGKRAAGAAAAAAESAAAAEAAAREAAAQRREREALAADLERKKAALNMLPEDREVAEVTDESLRRQLRELRSCLACKADPAKLETAGTATMTYPNMSEMDIRRMLRVHVPSIDDRIAPRFEGRPTIEVIVITYNDGLPNYKGPISDHLAISLRRSLSTIREADEKNAPGVGRRRALCARLADAFEACQAVQARVIEQLAEELAEGPAFERELRSMVVELRERTLDRTIMALFPESAREAEAPGAAFAHMMNTYRQALGITRINHEGTDRLAAGGGGDHMTAKNREDATRLFSKHLDVLGLVDDVVRDVNQPTGANERRIDRDGLGKWAGEQPAIAHRIFFNEEDAALYDGARPTKTAELDDTTQPFLHRALAIEILHMVLVQRIGAA